jgi:transcription initiation factor TFIIB
MNREFGKKYTNCEIEELLKEIDDKKVSNADCCPECGSIDFIEDYAKGMVLCRCGQMIDTIIDMGIEKKNYDGDEGETARCGIVHNRLLPQSSLGTSVTAKGKLKKLHIWNSMPYKERSDNIMFKRIHAICVAHNISRKIEDDSKILCKRVSGTVHKTGKNKGKTIITRGFNRSGIVAGCLFIACRRNDETRSTKEIAVYFEIDERDVNKGIRSLLDILDDDEIIKDIGTSKVAHFIQRKCDELHIKMKYAKVAMTIANNIDRLSTASNHTTYSLAAASILLMADINGLKSITKKRLSKTFCGLSDVTIGKTFKQIKEQKLILINNIIVDDICKEIERQKKRRVISREIWDKMILFNVPTDKYILEGHEDEYYLDEENTNIELKINIESDINKIQKSIWSDKNLIIKKKYSDKRQLSDEESANSNEDFEFMVSDIKTTAKELKYMKSPNNDAMDIFTNIHNKLDILSIYISQWAIESGILDNNVDTDY